MEGITFFNPVPPRRFDLIHAFNRIPFSRTPFVIGFESHLPRAFGFENTRFFRAMANRLSGDRCRAVIAISEYARRQFIKQHTGQPWYDSLAAKLIVRYPNIVISPEKDAFRPPPNNIVRLVFVGNHFGRKGGAVAVRIAAWARKCGFPLKLDIISSVEVGAVSWTDPIRTGYFNRDIQLLHTLPNIKHHGSVPNHKVLSLIREAHFLLLPTFSDSFGYSTIEAMAQSTPVIATAQGALPEFIEDGVNGFLLSLEKDEVGEWKHIGYPDRDSPSYEALYENEVERLAMESYRKIENLMQTPANYLSFRTNARATAERLFSSTDANPFWDNLYDRALPN